MLNRLKGLVYSFALIDFFISTLNQFLINLHSISKYFLGLLNVCISLHHRWNPGCPDFLITLLIMTGWTVLQIWNTWLSFWEWSGIPSKWSSNLGIQILSTCHSLWVDCHHVCLRLIVTQYLVSQVNCTLCCGWLYTLELICKVSGWDNLLQVLVLSLIWLKVLSMQILGRH